LSATNIGYITCANRGIGHGVARTLAKQHVEYQVVEMQESDKKPQGQSVMGVEIDGTSDYSVQLRRSTSEASTGASTA
jgi:hypothetical protein